MTSHAAVLHDTGPTRMEMRWRQEQERLCVTAVAPATKAELAGRSTKDPTNEPVASCSAAGSRLQYQGGRERASERAVQGASQSGGFPADPKSKRSRGKIQTPLASSANALDTLALLASDFGAARRANIPLSLLGDTTVLSTRSLEPIERFVAAREACSE